MYVDFRTYIDVGSEGKSDADKCCAGVGDHVTRVCQATTSGRRLHLFLGHVVDVLVKAGKLKSAISGSYLPVLKPC